LLFAILFTSGFILSSTCSAWHGIRKTLGASVSAIAAMMSGDFMKLSFIAALIGCPVAYYLVQQFLAGYAYHVGGRVGVVCAHCRYRSRYLLAYGDLPGYPRSGGQPGRGVEE
jgi:hypothetical protein